MSTFMDEYQRRARAVVAQATGAVVAPDAEVKVEIETEIDGDECCGTWAVVTIEVETWDGTVRRSAEFTASDWVDGKRSTAMEVFMAAMDAVPDAPPTNDRSSAVRTAVRDALPNAIATSPEGTETLDDVYDYAADVVARGVVAALDAMPDVAS